MRKKFLLAVPVGICCLVLIIWLYPRTIESLTGISKEKILSWSLEQQSSDAGVTDESNLEYFYSLSFSRPIYCSALTYNCVAYDVFLESEEGGRRFTLLEDGTLWDGTWRYSLIGGARAHSDLVNWLQCSVQTGGTN